MLKRYVAREVYGLMRCCRPITVTFGPCTTYTRPEVFRSQDLVRSTQLDRVDHYVRFGQEDGAIIATNGRPIDDFAGHLYEPTLEAGQIFVNEWFTPSIEPRSEASRVPASVGRRAKLRSTPTTSGRTWQSKASADCGE